MEYITMQSHFEQNIILYKEKVATKSNTLILQNLIIHNWETEFSLYLRLTTNGRNHLHGRTGWYSLGQENQFSLPPTKNIKLGYIFA